MTFFTDQKSDKKESDTKNYFISTDKNLLDREKIFSLLTNCFWSKNIPIEYVERFIQFSLCFGIYKDSNNQLVGFARIISDYTTYAYLCDVVIDSLHQKKGLGSRLVKEIMAHPDLQGLKTWSLRTTDEAKKIYLKNGFVPIDNHQTLLEIDDLEVYSRADFRNLHEQKEHHENQTEPQPSG